MIFKHLTASYNNLNFLLSIDTIYVHPCFIYSLPLKSLTVSSHGISKSGKKIVFTVFLELLVVECGKSVHSGVRETEGESLQLPAVCSWAYSLTFQALGGLICAVFVIMSHLRVKTAMSHRLCREGKLDLG